MLDIYSLGEGETILYLLHLGREKKDREEVGSLDYSQKKERIEKSAYSHVLG